MIELRSLSKSFSVRDGNVEALKNVNLRIADGEIYGIIGMSGAGKSTLVRIINMLERPTSGQVLIDGVDMESLTPAQLRTARRSMTMIFQHFNLLMQRTCLDNVIFPMEISGVPRREAKKRAQELLDLVGLPDKANTYPARLSGGQKQRVAIARSLATNPKILLCDEATSALDPTTTHAILSLIRDINKKMGITVVMITHQMSVVEEICTRVAILDHGEVAEEGSVDEIFSHPRSQAARRLVFPGLEEKEEEPASPERQLRISFHGAASAGSPLISRMAIEKGLMVNISAASTHTVGGKVYGYMLISVPNPGDFDAVKAYLDACGDILTEEV